MTECDPSSLAFIVVVLGGLTIGILATKEFFFRARKKKGILGNFSNFVNVREFDPVEEPDTFISVFFEKGSIEEVNTVILKKSEKRQMYLADMALRFRCGVTDENMMQSDGVEDDRTRMLTRDVTLVMIPVNTDPDATAVMLVNSTYGDSFVNAPTREEKLKDPVPGIKDYFSITTYNLPERIVPKIFSETTLERVRQYWKDDLPLYGIVISRRMLIIIHKRIIDEKQLWSAMSADEKLADTLPG